MLFAIITTKKAGLCLFFLPIVGSIHQVNKDCILDIIRKQRLLPVAKFDNYEFNNNNNNRMTTESELKCPHMDQWEETLAIYVMIGFVERTASGMDSKSQVC